MKKIAQYVLIILSIFVLAIIIFSGCIPDVPDIDPPFVQVIYPSAGSVVNGTVPVVAAASDDDEVKEVRIYIDGIVRLTTGDNFATYSWNTDPIADNLTHYVSAVAIDQADNVGYSAVTGVQVARGQNEDITSPVVSILYPVGGQVISEPINIVAEAHDDNQVTKVEFYIDGYLDETVTSVPFDYLWDVTQVDSGSHSIFVRAYDANNNSSASATLTVTVNTSLAPMPGHNIEPGVRIMAPERNRVLFSESEASVVPIKLDFKNAPAINRVEVYIDGALQKVFSENIEQTMSYDWNLEGYGDGLLHSIFVKAFYSPTQAKVDMILVTVNP